MPNIHVSAALILDSGGRMLVVRKAGTDVFMQPGGKPEPGESAAETLVRELSEEVGIILTPGELRPLGQFSAPAANEDGHTVVADVFEAIGAFTPEPRAEIVELRWVSAAEARALGARLAPLSATHFLDRLR
ncbi:MAG: NUDIX hydrolase [Agromyces sp.]